METKLLTNEIVLVQEIHDLLKEIFSNMEACKGSRDLCPELKIAITKTKKLKNDLAENEAILQLISDFKVNIGRIGNKMDEIKKEVKVSVRSQTS